MMKLPHSLACLVILWTVISLAVQDDEYLTIKLKVPSVTITFSQRYFEEFYKCLCMGTEACEVKYNNGGQVTSINWSKERNNTFKCKCYKCSTSSRKFKCTHELSFSCYSSNNYQYLQVTSSSGNSTDCVGFLMTNIDTINYNNSQGEVKTCNTDQQCLTGVQTTTSTTNVVTTSSTSRLTTTQPPAKTSKTAVVKTSTTLRPTTRQHSSATQATAATSTVKSSETRIVESTTAFNMTVSNHAFSSDNKPDNSSVILGVTLSIVVIIAVVVVVVVVFLRRRKRKLPHKQTSDERDYVNVSKTATTSQNGELKKTPNMTQNSPNKHYSNCAFDNAMDTHATENITNSENSEMYTNKQQSNLNHEFVYSKAESLEKTANTDSNVASDTNYTYIDNTLDETVDEGGDTYAVVRNASSISDLNHDQPKVYSLAGNPKANLKEEQHQTHAKGHGSKDDTRNIKVGLINPKTGNRTMLNGYENIDPTSSSHLNSVTHNLKVPNTPHLNVQQTDPSISPNVADNRFPSYQPNTTLSHIPNENIEYSLATIPHCPQNSNGETEATHIYNKLRENETKLQNPYDELLRPNLDHMPAQPIQATSPTRVAMQTSSQNTPHLNVKQTGPSISPKAAANRQPISQPSTTSSHIPNENVEYSLAAIPHCPQNSNDEYESTNVYNKLRETDTTMLNPYNELLRPNLEHIPTQSTQVISPTRKAVQPSSQGRQTEILGTYSTAKSILDVPSTTVDDNGVYHDSGNQSLNVPGNSSGGDVHFIADRHVYFELEAE